MHQSAQQAAGEYAVGEVYELAHVIPTSFCCPKAIAVDGAGAVYVGCGGFVGGVQKFVKSNEDDNYLSAWTFGEGLDGYAVRGLARAPAGEVLLTVNLRREADEQVQVFSPDGRLLTCWGASGEADGAFRAPTGIACTPSGDVYVAEATHKAFKGGNRIQHFGKGGAFLAKWGHAGQAAGEFNLPTGIALDPHGNVHVADTYNSRVQAFAPDGTFRAQWGTYGYLPGEFNCPQGIAFDAAGNCFIADTGNHRLQKFAPDGTLLALWGGRGMAPGACWLPCGLAVDGAGCVYLADTVNNRVQVFRPRPEGRR